MEYPDTYLLMKSTVCNACVCKHDGDCVHCEEYGEIRMQAAKDHNKLFIHKMKRLYELGISPASWSVCLYGNHEEILDSNEKVIAVTQNSDNSSNAHLISAAPDLYEALLDLVKFMRCTPWKDEREAVKKAEAALEKAGGEK